MLSDNLLEALLGDFLGDLFGEFDLFGDGLVDLVLLVVVGLRVGVFEGVAVVVVDRLVPSVL